MQEFDGARVVLTGGTGSFGRAFLRHLLTHHDPAAVVLTGRDEYRQHRLVDDVGDRRVRAVLADVRDARRVAEVVRGADVVVHAAALKRVDAAEVSPREFVATNVDGTAHVLDACLAHGVGRLAVVSTDKACAPVSAYGATKLLAERLTTAAAVDLPLGAATVAGVVRLPNLLGSRGSVVETWRRALAAGRRLRVTDPRMTRFAVGLDEAAAFTAHAAAALAPGETWLPRAAGFGVADLAEAMAPGSAYDVVGPRPGERAHELLADAEEVARARGGADAVVVPAVAAPVVVGDPSGLAPGPWSSERAGRRLGVEELRRLVAEAPTG